MKKEKKKNFYANKKILWISIALIIFNLIGSNANKNQCDNFACFLGANIMLIVGIYGIIRYVLAAYKK